MAFITHFQRHLGDLEKTLFTKFLEAQKLRSLLQRTSVIKGLRPFLNVFERFFKKSMVGTGLNDNIPYDNAFKLLEEEDNWEPHMATSIPLAQQHLLDAWIRKYDSQANEPIDMRAYYRRSVHRLGQTFAMRQDSVPNSHIVYSLGASDWSAASITSIFSHTRTRTDGSRRTQTFAVVQNFKPVIDCAEDVAFRRYPEVGGRVVSAVLDPDAPAILLSMDQVDSHFVSCSFDSSNSDEEPECFMICLPLEKVCQVPSHACIP